MNILQMAGRAGRPQFDDSGVVVIMTATETRNLYENISSGEKKPVESHLHKSMIEHLNAEIALSTISDMNLAVKWLESTFLYVRIHKNPTYYNIPSSMKSDKIDEKLKSTKQFTN